MLEENTRRFNFSNVKYSTLLRQPLGFWIINQHYLLTLFDFLIYFSHIYSEKSVPFLDSLRRNISFSNAQMIFYNSN